MKVKRSYTTILWMNGKALHIPNLKELHKKKKRKKRESYVKVKRDYTTILWMGGKALHILKLRELKKKSYMKVKRDFTTILWVGGQALHNPRKIACYSNNSYRRGRSEEKMRKCSNFTFQRNEELLIIKLPS
ncbi:unnamed protein product [Camellia sinensis]